MRASLTLLFLLCTAIPVEANTVVALLTLALAVDTRWLLFAAIGVWSAGRASKRAIGAMDVPFHFARLAWPRAMSAIDRKASKESNSPATIP